MKSFKKFIFEQPKPEYAKSQVTLNYSFDNELKFSEKLTWSRYFTFDQSDHASSLEFLSLVLGVSYYKAYLAPEIEFPKFNITDEKAKFLNKLYSNGLGEFLYKNNLNFSEIAEFKSNTKQALELKDHQNKKESVLVPVSGGKDSLLSASILEANGINFTPVYISTDGNYPKLLDKFQNKPLIITRKISSQLLKENKNGAYNGHVPFSAILDAILIFTAVVYGYSTIVLSHESSANEATTTYKGRNINHQYSKTSEFDRELQNYCHRYINPALSIFSILGDQSELEINRLFVQKGIFDKYKGLWSSCNIANYKQDQNTSELVWCSRCSKCANAFLMLAPWLDKTTLVNMFNGKNLLTDPQMKDIFQDLLGQSEAKPFECVAEVNELRTAAKMLQDLPEWPEADRLPTELIPVAIGDNQKTDLPYQYKTALETFINR